MEPVLCLPQPRRALGELYEDHVAGGGEVQPLSPGSDGNDEHAAALVGVELRQPRGPETPQKNKKVRVWHAFISITSVFVIYAFNKAVICMLGEEVCGAPVVSTNRVWVVYAFNKPALFTSFVRGEWCAYVTS